MSDYVIEKGIPLPDPGKRHFGGINKRSGLCAAFANMEFGDSLFTTKTLQAISAAAIKSGAHVTSRKEGAGYRVWRTE